MMCVDPMETPARPCALFVDDDKDMRILVERMLSSRYDVTTAADVQAALGFAHTQHFDIVILDIALRGKQSGMDLLQVLRALPGYERVPALAFTVYFSPKHRKQFLKAGFDAHLSKPFTIRALSDELDRLLCQRA